MDAWNFRSFPFGFRPHCQVWMLEKSSPNGGDLMVMNPNLLNGVKKKNSNNPKKQIQVMASGSLFHGL